MTGGFPSQRVSNVENVSIWWRYHDLVYYCEAQSVSIVNQIPEHGCLKYMILHQYLSITHWGRVTHICVSKLTIIGSDNGLSPGRRQAIIWTNAGILLIRPLGTHFNDMLIEILTFSFMKMRLKVSSAKWRPFCLGLNVFK